MADRRRELAAIHVGRQRLGLAEQDYRAILRRVTGKASAAELDDAERRRMLDELRRLGFAAARPRPLAEPQHRMIRGLWIDLGKAGKLRDRSDRALDAFCKRMTGIDRLEWLPVPAANSVIEALKAWRERDTERECATTST